MPNGKRNLPKHVQNFYQILNGPFNFFQSFKILTKWQNFAKSGHTDFECTHCCCWWSVCTDWAIFCSLGNHSKPVATIILSILPTLLGNFCKGIKIIHFSSEIILGNFDWHLAIYIWSHCWWWIHFLTETKNIWEAITRRRRRRRRQGCHNKDDKIRKNLFKWNRSKSKRAPTFLF